MVQFNISDYVFLMNPSIVKMKVASERISGVVEEHKFHFKEIPKLWCKVDVLDIVAFGVALMYPNEDMEQILIEHAKGSAAI